MRRKLRVASIALALVSAAALAQEAPAYGTIESYVRVQAVAFFPLSTADGPYYTTGNGGGFGGQLARHGAGNSSFTASLNLPSGALITSLEFNYCDLNAGSNRSYLHLVETAYNGNVQATTPILYSVYGSCSFALADVSSSGIVVDNYFNSYHLAFHHNIGDGSMTITGASVGYKLQVSPPPGTASFNDVPVGHPFYQFIEALSASGITGGCGGGNYCPDNPVTRGQMAVFLAKALGLSFR